MKGHAVRIFIIGSVKGWLTQQLTSLRSETGGQGVHKPEGGCLHPYSSCSIQIRCAMIPAGISGDTAAEHASLWHPPSQCHVTPVQHALPLPTMPGVHSLQPICIPSTVGLMFCLSGLHTLWGSHCNDHPHCSFPPIFPAHSHLTCPSPTGI